MIASAASGQWYPLGHGIAAVEFSIQRSPNPQRNSMEGVAQNLPALQPSSSVDPGGQNVPSLQSWIWVGSGQNEPAGQGSDLIDPSGQYSPRSHWKDCDGSGQ